MTRLHLNLLGGFEARLEPGSPLTFRTQKAQALLAYLAMPPGQVHRRDKLAALLWGAMRDEQARTSLRQALYDLRKNLGNAARALRTEGETVSLDPTAVELDVTTFTAIVGQETPESLEQAVLLYRGDLLEGFSVDEEPFETWLMEERERLRELAMDVLARGLSHQRKTGALAAALRTARQLLAIDRLQEPVHRTLMRLHAQLGQRAAALRQYQQCVTVLQRELGVEPELETKQLYREILRQRATASEPTAGLASSGTARRLARAGLDTQLAETPLVGRDAPLAQAHEALQQAHAGSGQLVAILGETGIGKSRLVEELIAHAAHDKWRILLGRAYESDQILLFGPFVDAFRADELFRDAEVMEALGPVWRAELSTLLPRLATLLGAPRLPERVDYRRLFECIVQLLQQLSAREPLLLVLEDLHWADELSLRLLAFLGRRVQTERILIVLTAREEELADNPVLRRTLQDLSQRQHLSSVQLSALSQTETAVLVELLAPPRKTTAIEPLGQQVWVATEGNPFMIVETMRGLQDGTAETLALPQRVREVIGRRLERLVEGSRSLLSVAAVIGREFDFELLRRVAGFEEDATAQGVEELVRRRLLTAIGDRLDFSHHRIREVAYGELPPWRRRRLHCRVAQTIEDLYVDRLPDFWEALAEHFERAARWAKAADYYLAVAERARTRYAYTTAERSCQQAAIAATQAPDAGEQRTRAFELQGDVASLRGDLEGANQHYQAAIDLEPTEPVRHRLANKLHLPRLTYRDGACLAFYEHGTGAETLLFMNPIVYGLEIFQPVLEHLCQEFRIITMDARGTGRSDTLRPGYATCDHAADVGAVIEAAGGPVTAIGISKSSSILVRLAIAAPALVKKLVLIGTLLDFWPNTASPAASELDGQFRAALQAGDFERAMRLFVATIVTDPDTGELADQFTRNLLRLPQDTILSTWAPDPDVDITPVLQQVKTPTLVLHGTQDSRVPLATAHYLAEHLPDARLYLFQGVGHLPIFAATAEFCDVLRRFVRTGEIDEGELHSPKKDTQSRVAAPH
jgi:DNA-binding SARP family transcriptional activator/pimeloyl-ACP methyl ester carboxylesterase